MRRGDAAARDAGSPWRRSRGDAAAATWIVRGDEPRRRRGCGDKSQRRRGRDVDIPRRRRRGRRDWVETGARLRFHCDKTKYGDASNVLSVAFAPKAGAGVAYAAWELFGAGSGADWVPACCGAYVKIDLSEWW